MTPGVRHVNVSSNGVRIIKNFHLELVDNDWFMSTL